VGTGRNSGGGILPCSHLGETLEEGTLCVPRKSLLPGTTNEAAPYVIVGVEGYDVTRETRNFMYTKKVSTAGNN
jgi:hypothetical protein